MEKLLVEKVRTTVVKSEAVHNENKYTIESEYLNGKLIKLEGKVYQGENPNQQGSFNYSAKNINVSIYNTELDSFEVFGFLIKIIEEAKVAEVE